MQRILYIIVGLPMVIAKHDGTWDTINGAVYPNSYYTIMAIVFVASQFMGTSKSYNNRDLDAEMKE